MYSRPKPIALSVVVNGGRKKKLMECNLK